MKELLLMLQKSLDDSVGDDTLGQCSQNFTYFVSKTMFQLHFQISHKIFTNSPMSEEIPQRELPFYHRRQHFVMYTQHEMYHMTGNVKFYSWRISVPKVAISCCISFYTINNLCIVIYYSIIVLQIHRVVLHAHFTVDGTSMQYKKENNDDYILFKLFDGPDFQKSA